MAKTLLLILALIPTGFTVAGQHKTKNLTDKSISLPPGFKLSIFADNVPGARQMAYSPDGILFVGTTSNNGRVFGLRISKDFTKSTQQYTLARGLNRPNGVAYKDGALYIAEVNRITRYDGINQRLANPPIGKVVYDQLPNKPHHGLKYLRFGPDAKLYTGIGAPCNSCKPDKKIFASMVRLNTDGSNFEIIAHGIRNTLGFDWQPNTDNLFFADIGRDYLGDDLPPEELNQLIQTGSHFGFPYCHAGNIADPELGYQKDCQQFQAPKWTFKAHMTPLGIHFYRGTLFPTKYRGQLLVALHGSWNRSKPHGYQIALVRFDQDQPVDQETFAEGWLLENDVLGRPVDILELPDGSILVSDDYRGVIYRISYQQP